MKTPRRVKSNPKDKSELKAPQKSPAPKESGKVVKKKPSAKKAALKKVTTVPEVKESPKTLTAADLAKIEKKKAKKQAQKVKKQERKQAAPVEQPKAQEEPKKSQEAAVATTPQKQVVKASAKKANDKDKDAVKRERDPAAEATTVFVGNLPVNTKRVQLVRLFAPYGSIKFIRLRTASGKQLFKHKQRKGAGSLNAYVVLDSVENAAKALALNGSEFKEHHLRVTPASQSDGGVGEDEAEGKRVIFVGSLKYSATEEKLREIFSSCGEIDYVRCLQDGDKGCKGVAYVRFKTADAVGLALELNKTLVDDRPMHVERYSVKKLGAKEQRDAASAAVSKAVTNAKTKQNSAGAKKRLNKKQLKENGKPQPAAAAGNKKKSEYRGVKVDGGGIKKNKKSKKKSNTQMQTLAKKIAPKPKA